MKHRHLDVHLLGGGCHRVVRATRLQRVDKDLQIVINNRGGQGAAARGQVTRRLHSNQRGFLDGDRIRHTRHDPVGHTFQANAGLGCNDLVIHAGHSGD